MYVLKFEGKKIIMIFINNKKKIDNQKNYIENKIK